MKRYLEEGEEPQVGDWLDTPVPLEVTGAGGSTGFYAYGHFVGISFTKDAGIRIYRMEPEPPVEFEAMAQVRTVSSPLLPTGVNATCIVNDGMTPGKRYRVSEVVE